jgi:pyruvate dehydrogenase complex dehydrogenase (E1) component
VPFYHPGEDSPEVQYLQERRAALGGYLPRAAARPQDLRRAGLAPTSAC